MQASVNLMVAVMIALAARVDTVAAAEVNAGGVAFTVPDGWLREARGAWIRREGGLRTASLVVAVLPAHTSVTGAGLEAGRRLLEAAARERGASKLSSWDLQLTRLGGAPAYRVRASQAGQAGAEARVEQIQYIVSGKSTVALTFSCAAEDFETEQPGFERVASTLEVREAAGILDEMPAPLCGTALGILAGLGLAARRRCPGLTGRFLR